MSRLTLIAALLTVLSTPSCATEKQITDSLRNQLSSVTGDWTGTATAQNAIRLDFRLQEGTNGVVSGSGSMKEDSATAQLPVTVSGTFVAPNLELTFQGMRYEEHAVQGTAQGAYTTVAGILTTLQLTGSGYSKSLPILLQEK